jgi:hypothetical protein
VSDRRRRPWSCWRVCRGDLKDPRHARRQLADFVTHLVLGTDTAWAYDLARMGQRGVGQGFENLDGLPVDSVTEAGGPVLLAAVAPALGRGTVLAGRYQIEAVIGRGGSGQVLRAFDRVARTPVALKILRSEFAADPIWRERFSRELRVGRQIQHPNVCRVFDIGDSDGHKFLSMELATGGTIRVRLEAGGVKRTFDERVADARAVVDGVAALHASGVIHRDLKPENILRMEDGRLIVSDFGLATDPGSGPATTVMIGTPRYMAPEVVMGDPATTRSDVWALGIVLHEILFGTRPDRTIVRRGYRQFTLPPVESLKERRLAELCGRCSEEDLDKRPESATEVRREFDVAMQGRRFTQTTVRRDAVWGVIALAALASLGLIRNRWTNRAVASSSQVAAGSVAKRVLQSSGIVPDWGVGSTRLASLAGRLHCSSLIDGGKKIRAIWGAPRRAEDIDVVTGQRKPSRLLPVTYQEGCPQLAPDGSSLLFDKTDETGTHVALAPFPDGRNARMLLRGSAPEWLPNGQEFVFDLDSRHEAMFSLPTGQMTIVGDGIKTPRQLAEKAVSADGSRLAVRYFTDTSENLVVIQSIPSLDLVGQFVIPPSARMLQFSSTGDQVTFSLDGSEGVAELVSADWVGTALKTVGKVHGADVRKVLSTSAGSVIMSRKLKKDLWLDNRGQLNRLTDDGQSDGGSISTRGDLVVQRRLLDGRYVIVFKPSNGREVQVTNGPMDMAPSFFPDGKTWVYADYSTQSIVRCLVSNKTCATVHSDRLTPALPVGDPNGEQMAYISFMNIPRLHLLSLKTGTDRDLGPVAPDCAPVWTSATRLWVTTPTSHGPEWAEIDTSAGRRTGRIQAMVAHSSRECEVPREVTAGMGLSDRRVSVVVDEVSDFLRHTDTP